MNWEGSHRIHALTVQLSPLHCILWWHCHTAQVGKQLSELRQVQKNTRIARGFQTLAQNLLLQWLSKLQYTAQAWLSQKWKDWGICPVHEAECTNEHLQIEAWAAVTWLTLELLSRCSECSPTAWTWFVYQLHSCKSQHISSKIVGVASN